jgi:hypothetical protein
MVGAQNITNEQAFQICEYLLWADLHEVELKVPFTYGDVHHCFGLQKAFDQYYNYVDASLQQLGATQFKQYLHDHIRSVAQDLNYNLSMHYQMHNAKADRSVRPAEQHRNNVDNQPRYVFLMADEMNIDLFLSAVMQGSNKTNAVEGAHNQHHKEHARHVIPSSTLFFELVERDDDLYVEGYFNDEPLHLGGCHHIHSCTAANFAHFLNTTIAYTNVTAACQLTNGTSSSF